MYISEIAIDGYKNCRDKSIISFHPGLNILVGENASGKTTIIDAIRMVLRDQEMGHISEDDFYKAFDLTNEKKNICIDLKMSNLTPQEKVTFLTWCNADFDAELHLEVEKNPNTKGYYKKSIWGGKAKSSAFEEETFDYIDVIYLPALRDAEEKLQNGRKSRLALLLKHQYKNEDRMAALVEEFSNFNKSVISNKDHKFDELEQAKNGINNAMIQSMGNVFGQSVNLQFSENTFSSILQNIKMVFFPHIGEVDEEKFRDVAINSLGYNNLLYVATVFAELEIINKQNSLFTVLLIEEPEAHLHPQIQSKLIKYLQSIAEQQKNLQIILTTHSAVIASSVNIESIIHISSKDFGISSMMISDFSLEKNEKNYLNRWMDITKSTLLFSKGVILVEGICEAMVIPALAPFVLKKYNENNITKLPESLEEAGVTVINVNGVNFKYFFPLFCDMAGSNEERLPIRCSAITDRDPKPKTIVDEDGKTKSIEVYPLTTGDGECGNEAAKMATVINETTNGRLFVSPLKTFEYDLAMNGNCSLMAEVIKEGWPKGDEDHSGVKNDCFKIQQKNNNYEDEESKREDAKYILNHIDHNDLGKGLFAQLLSEKLENGKIIQVPQYIENAIIWASGGKYNE